MEKTLEELIAERDELLDNIKAAIESGDDNAFGKAVTDITNNCLATVSTAVSGTARGRSVYDLRPPSYGGRALRQYRGRGRGGRNLRENRKSDKRDDEHA